MKTTKEKIDVMQGFEEGKPIQIRTNKKVDSKWFDFKDTPNWNWEENDYRIKPEPKEPTYRPYESVAEMLCDYKRRVRKINNHPKNTMPLIWLKCSETGAERLATGFDREGNNVFVGYWRDMSELYTDYQYLDGTPFGRLVEE